MADYPTLKSSRLLSDLKVPPHSIEAEQAVLGSLMLGSQAWDEIADCVRAVDFYRPEHRTIFQTIADLIQKASPVDVLTVTEALRTAQKLDEVGGEIYLFELAKNTPTIANILAYSHIVRDRSIVRQLFHVATEIAESTFAPEGQSSTELLDNAERKIFAIAEQHVTHQGPVNIKQLLAKAVDRIDTLYHSDQSVTGLSTGYQDLDNFTAGLQPADLVIIAGRPSMGKTMLGMNIAEHAVLQTGKPTLVFSMEMPGDALAMRAISSLGRIDQHRLRTGKLQETDWPRIHSTMSLLSDTPLFIDDTPALTPSELRARARRLARETGQLGLIVIDYLQLMQSTGFKENRTAEISDISRSLKALAKELNVPVIALSQLNRGLEQRADKRPVMSDLRESGAIEQDADVILFIYRDEVYNEDSREKGVAEIIIAKQRNGPIGKIKLTFLGQYTRFENHIHSF